LNRITGCPTGKFRGELLASALRSRDESTGCLIDEGDAVGNIKQPAWPQTEIAEAWLAQAERVRREPQNKRARHCRASIGIIFDIRSLAAGRISSIATAGRWSRPSRHPRSIMCVVVEAEQVLG
jgi:hypothetical protein